MKQYIAKLWSKVPTSTRNFIVDWIDNVLTILIIASFVIGIACVVFGIPVTLFVSWVFFPIPICGFIYSTFLLTYASRNGNL